ncbi:hypothetical protein [uncultured Victivallis sp.]|uniref:hypothetical protein n=1 Tax=uncultured Victivallis sp. TaxID=354118 RepID=UPI0025FF3FFC|nr:hypothetical protein [uncultured Victivallis sp.]
MKSLSVLGFVFAALALGAAEFRYSFEAEKDPLEVFKRDKTPMLTVESYDENWILKTRNVNAGLMLWQTMRTGELTFEGGLFRGGLRVYALYEPRDGKGIGVFIPSAGKKELKLVSTLSGKMETLAQGTLDSLPEKLAITLKITDQQLEVYSGERKICEAALPPGAKRGSFYIQGTWGTELKLKTFTVESPDLRK